MMIKAILVQVSPVILINCIDKIEIMDRMITKVALPIRQGIIIKMLILKTSYLENYLKVKIIK